MRLSKLEITAILANLIYTWLYLKETNWAWPFALVGALAYFMLCKKNNLIGESWLQLFYICAGIIGWIAPVSSFHSPLDSAELQIDLLCASLFIWMLARKVLVNRNTSYPWLDSFVLIFGITGTVLQVLYSPLNWYYFLLVNLVSMYTYWNKGMRLSILLYIVYFLLSIQGIYDSISS